MQTPPAHVLARLDDIIVGQEEAKDGGGTPPRHVLLQNCDDDDDADAAFGPGARGVGDDVQVLGRELESK